MAEHIAESGLSILNYLGIFGLTKQEREFFKKNWQEFYNLNDKDPILTTWALYEELPFICGNYNKSSSAIDLSAVQALRDADFETKIKKSNLYRKLKEGLSLEQIFSASPERFFSLN